MVAPRMVGGSNGFSVTAVVMIDPGPSVGEMAMRFG